ncbi:MAG: DUF423 domain-containing protein [Bacteroidetes bacterium]|nr:MAG: DUF423 domain-containing protein [Bacteroidota bacterium]
MTIHRSTLAWAAAFAAIAVILGALGAHALKGQLSAESLESFKTGVRYQMWHALALAFLALLPSKEFGLRWTKTLWIFGIILFSGSIYLLSIAPIFDFNFRFLGPITPLGGIALILGWIVLFFKSLRAPNNP